MDELEAVIWAAMRKHQVTSPSPGALVADLLAAALAWAAGDSDDVTLRRRQVLVRDGWRLPASDDHLLVPRLRPGPDR